MAAAVKDGYRQLPSGIYVAERTFSRRLLEGLPKPEGAYDDRGGKLKLLLAAQKAGLPVLLLGPTGVGKTSIVAAAARALKTPYVRVPCEADDLTSTYIGGLRTEHNGERLTVFVDGLATTVARAGEGVIFFDEVNRGPQRTFVTTMTDHERVLILNATQEVLPLENGVFVVAACNPTYMFGAYKPTPAFRQRFVTVHLQPHSKDEMVRILTAKFASNGIVEAVPMLEPSKLTETDLKGISTAIGEVFEVIAGERKSGKYDLEELPSHRLAENALRLIKQGIAPLEAVEHSIVAALVDEVNDVYQGLIAVFKGKKPFKE